MKKSLMVVTLLLVWPFNCWCAIIRVPENFSTIQAALDATAEGDSVVVGAGTYYCNLRFPEHNFSLFSDSLFGEFIYGDTTHISATILDGGQPLNPDSASVIIINGGQDSTTIICGFTIRNGGGTKLGDFKYGGGIFINNASPTVCNNLFEGNSANNGGGIYLLNSNTQVISNEFRMNEATFTGGCVRADSCSYLALVNNDMYNNYGNIGAGIRAVDCGDVVITGNKIHENSGANSIVSVVSAVTVQILDNVISDNINTGVAGGAGILVQDVVAYIVGNLFENNIGGMTFGALCLTGNSSGVVVDNTFTGNYSSSGGNAIFMCGSHFVISGCSFTENSSDGNGAAILVSQFVGVRIDYCSFTDNVGGQYGSCLITVNPVDSCIVQNSNFSGNLLTMGLVPGYGNKAIDARFNYWGDPSGPSHWSNPNGQGDGIGDHVLYSPWGIAEVGVVEPDPPVLTPTSFELYPAYPNPFNATTVISYQLPVKSHVVLRIYNSAGRLVATLADGWRDAGTQEVNFNATNLASGVYFLSLKTNKFRSSGKLILVK